MSELKLTTHARAQGWIRAAKGWGGLVAFALVLLLSKRAGTPWTDALTRAVPAGVAGMLVAWAAAIAVSKQLVLAELEAHRRRLTTRPEPEAEA